MLTYPIVFGARVRIRNWPSRFGAVVSVWNKTAMVKWDDLAKPERCYLDSLVPETAADVAKRAHAAAVNEWEKRMPETFVVTYRSGSGTADLVSNVSRPEDMRQAADELQLLAAWVETKPKETM